MKWLTVLISIGLLLAACVVVGAVLAQDHATNTTSSALDKPILRCEKQVASWQREAHIEIVLVIAVIIFGVVVSGLHGSNSPWAKKATLLLGIGTAIITGINSRVFTADDRTLRRAAFEGNAIINEMWATAAQLKDERFDEANRVTVAGEYTKKFLEFEAVGERLNGTAKAGPDVQKDVDRLESIPTVYAQSTAGTPSWAQNPPSDNVSLYFVGTSSDASLLNAKEKSLNDAFHKAAQMLRSQSPGTTDAQILALVKASALVQDTATLYDRQGQKFTCYTLLRLSKEIESIGLNVLPPANNVGSPPVRFRAEGWQPDDLASNPSSGLFTLGSNGDVSRLVADSQGPSRIEKLFRVMGPYVGIALAASVESVFVTTNSQLGCTVFKYTLKDKAVVQRLVATHESCAGIATDGIGFYVAFPVRKEIRHWENWAAASPERWTLGDTVLPDTLVFDDNGHRLIVADRSGRAYGISVPDGAKQLLASNLGAVTSIATTKKHILFASGKKVLFLSRSDNQGENPPANLQTLTGGHIVGVAIDATDGLWFADYENKLVEGPFPVS